MKFILSKFSISIFLLVVVFNLFQGSILLDRIIVVSIIAFCIAKGYKEKFWVNPYFLFSLVPLSLSVYFNIADAYMMNLTHHTWVLAIINMIAFLMAFSYTRDFKTKSFCVSIKNKYLVVEKNLQILECFGKK